MINNSTQLKKEKKMFDYRDEYMSIAMATATATKTNILCGPPKKDYNYDYIDQFIATNISYDLHISSISSKHIQRGKEIYNKLKNTQNQTPGYEIFGGNGYISYAIYKSKEQNLYLIKLNVQKLEDYIKLDATNENMFDL